MGRGCPGGARHWFTVRGHVGVPARFCDRCGAPNPMLARRLEAIGWTEADLDELLRGRGYTPGP